MVPAILGKFVGEISGLFLPQLQEKLPNGLPKHTNLCSVLEAMVPDSESHADKLRVCLTRPTALVAAAKVADTVKPLPVPRCRPRGLGALPWPPRKPSSGVGKQARCFSGPSSTRLAVLGPGVQVRRRSPTRSQSSSRTWDGNMVRGSLPSFPRKGPYASPIVSARVAQPKSETDFRLAPASRIRNTQPISVSHGEVIQKMAVPRCPSLGSVAPEAVSNLYRAPPDLVAVHLLNGLPPKRSHPTGGTATGSAA